METIIFREGPKKISESFGEFLDVSCGCGSLCVQRANLVSLEKHSTFMVIAMHDKGVNFGKTDCSDSELKFSSVPVILDI
jgi:hypothetical protein